MCIYIYIQRLIKIIKCYNQHKNCKVVKHQCPVVRSEKEVLWGTRSTPVANQDLGITVLKRAMVCVQKPWEALRKPYRSLAGALQKLCRSRTEALQKLYRSPTEALQKPNRRFTENLQKLSRSFTGASHKLYRSLTEPRRWPMAFGSSRERRSRSHARSWAGGRDGSRVGNQARSWAEGAAKLREAEHGKARARQGWTTRHLTRTYLS